MELLHLKYFQETARLEHMSRAAEALHISQPSLSQAIHRLEEEVGMPLFDREGRNIRLNEAGRIFLKYVDEVFQALDNASLELNELKSKKNCRVSICFQAASALLPDILSLIKEKNPNLEIQIYQKMGEIPPGQMDMVLASSREAPQDPDTDLLLKEELVAVLPKDHPLASLRELDAGKLSSLELISLSPDSSLYRIIDDYCRIYRIQLHITTYVDSPATMRELLRAGLGAAIIPERTWKGFAGKQTVTVPLKGCEMQRALTLSMNSSRYQTEAAKTCRDLICSYFEQLRENRWKPSGAGEISFS